ncbi:MAG: hypothetical protein ACE5R6_18805 [Candidatus Heimdallarchaeota archaeon]
MASINKNRFQVFWVSFVALSLPIGSTAANVDGFTVQVGTHAEWHIHSVNAQPVPWYRIGVWTYLGSWKAENGSEISYTVTAVNEDVYGDLNIGNLTVTNSSSAEIASALVLGILTWSPGLITHTDWVKHTEEAQEQANSEWVNGTLTVPEKNQVYMGKTFETISFILVSTSQNTTLVYEKNSGALLEAQTGFGAYFLDIEISSIDPPLKEVKGVFFSLTWLVVILPLLFLTGIRIWKRRERISARRKI